MKWKSSNSKIASVNSAGKVTGRKAGRAKITATVNKKKYTCTVTVKAAKKAVKVSKIKLNKKSISLNTGKSYTLKAAVSPSKASNKKLSWKSSNNAVVTVNSKGVVTAKKAGSAVLRRAHQPSGYRNSQVAGAVFEGLQGYDSAGFP